MALLSKADILAVNDLKLTKVDMPEWGGEVYLRTMRADERDAFEGSCFIGDGANRKTNYANLRARFCARIICDDKGQRLFTDAEVEQLGAKSAAALDRVFAEGQKLNAIAADSVDELEKN